MIIHSSRGPMICTFLRMHPVARQIRIGLMILLVASRLCVGVFYPYPVRGVVNDLFVNALTPASHVNIGQKVGARVRASVGSGMTKCQARAILSVQVLSMEMLEEFLGVTGRCASSLGILYARMAMHAYIIMHAQRGNHLILLRLSMAKPRPLRLNLGQALPAIMALRLLVTSHMQPSAQAATSASASSNTQLGGTNQVTQGQSSQPKSQIKEEAGPHNTWAELVAKVVLWTSDATRWALLLTFGRV